MRTQKLKRRTQFVGIFGVNVLDGLAMIFEDVDADDGFVEVGIRGLNQLVVHVLRVFQSVKSLMGGKSIFDIVP